MSTVDKVDVWGKRRLAYEIRKKGDGFYAVIDLAAEVFSQLARPREATGSS